jgi:hypothetical protein
MGRVVHFGAPGARNVDVLFFMVRWDRYGLHTKRPETHYSELMFLHPVGYAGNVVHSLDSGV